MKKSFILIPCVFLGVLGCQPNANVKADSSSSSTDSSAPLVDTKSPDSSPTPNSNLSTPTSTPQGRSTVPTSSTKPSSPNSPNLIKGASAPDAKPSTTSELEHEGFLYSGVGNSKPVDMELIMSTQPGTVTTGSQTVTLKENKDGRRVYAIDRTGGLAALGTEEWTVTKEGVFTTKSSLMDVGDKAMELPATPKPGMTWKAHAKSNQPGAAMDMDMTFKVIGTQDVSTKGGSFKSALVIEQDSTGTLQGKKVRTESQNWYVKGLGLVKATMKNHLPDGKTETLLIQETKSK